MRHDRPQMFRDVTITIVTTLFAAWTASAIAQAT